MCYMVREAIIIPNAKMTSSEFCKFLGNKHNQILVTTFETYLYFRKTH